MIGELHRAQHVEPVPRPTWLAIPTRGLFTGIAIFGAVGSGKTSGCMYPFAEQILAFRRNDRERRPGALVLEVKGDFCHRIREILERHGRGDDYVEISLSCEYRYNPLHNDLEAYQSVVEVAFSGGEKQRRSRRFPGCILGSHSKASAKRRRRVAQQRQSA